MLEHLLFDRVLRLAQHLFGRNHPLVWHTSGRTQYYDTKRVLFHALREVGHVAVQYANKRFAGWTWRATTSIEHIDGAELKPTTVSVQFYMKVGRDNEVRRLAIFQHSRRRSEWLRDIPVGDVFRDPGNVFAVLAQEPPLRDDAHAQRSFCNVFNVRDAAQVDYNVDAHLFFYEPGSLPRVVPYMARAKLEYADTDTEDNDETNCVH